MDVSSQEEKRELRVLILEDEPTDAELVEHTLRKAGLEFVAELVATRQGFVEALDRFKPDIVLSDYKLPDFDGLSALALVREKDQNLPVIAVSGVLGDEVAVELIKAGANDYVLKDRLARLPYAVQRAMAEAQERRKRYHAENALHVSENRLRHAIDSARDAIITIDGESGIITGWNPAAEAIFGFSCTEAIGKVLHEIIVPPRFRAAMINGLSNFVSTGKGAAVGKIEEFSGLHKNGTEFPIDLALSAMEIDGKWHAMGVVRDITDRKNGEYALLRLNRTLRTISATNTAVVRATSEELLLKEMCRIGVEIGGYRLVSIGFVEKDEAKTVRPVAWAGEHMEYLQVANITWANTERGHGPTGTAIRTGVVQVNQNVETNPAMAPWRSEMLDCGFKANAALPLANSSGVFGVLMIYASEPDAFGPEELDLLKQLAADLAFGISAQRDRVERDAAQLALQKNLSSTVKAIAAAVEIRDIYTAGHQQHVSDLAVAIARELGLPKLQIEGIGFAGMIHDVGKINIPAEILNKPGKLTPLEFQMIQTHVQSGYDIVKGIDFPWPIADTILQHHERLDGSGYPNKLKGEMILIEAKILAVADVVDAMMSHRPYRASLGLDAALAEVEAGKGRLYDPAAVDACKTLFRQKGFKWLDSNEGVTFHGSGTNGAREA